MISVGEAHGPGLRAWLPAENLKSMDLGPSLREKLIHQSGKPTGPDSERGVRARGNLKSMDLTSSSHEKLFTARVHSIDDGHFSLRGMAVYFIWHRGYECLIRG